LSLSKAKEEVIMIRECLSLAAEYSVASELCRRGLYAQLTLGTHKRTDILLETETGFLSIQVKAKLGNEWPNCKGIFGEDSLLVLVDFAGKSEDQRPDFYILSSNDWRDTATKRIRDRGWDAVLDDHNVPVFPKQLLKSGRPYKGIGVSPDMVAPYREYWDKITKLLSRMEK
jgi:hypothetical protein